jgi:hypothetical protein
VPANEISVVKTGDASTQDAAIPDNNMSVVTGSFMDRAAGLMFKENWITSNLWKNILLDRYVKCWLTLPASSTKARPMRVSCPDCDQRWPNTVGFYSTCNRKKRRL